MLNLDLALSDWARSGLRSDRCILTSQQASNEHSPVKNVLRQWHSVVNAAMWQDAKGSVPAKSHGMVFATVQRANYKMSRVTSARTERGERRRLSDGHVESELFGLRTRGSQS